VYGTTPTNTQIAELLKQGLLKIDPFEPENLKLAHYRLRPFQLWRPGPQLKDGGHRRSFVHDFEEGPYQFEPNEYLIVTLLEHVTISGHLVGSVLPASTLVEQCFSLTAGKLDPGYGAIGGKKQDFIMGIKNMLDEPNWFHPERGVANISFVDFRGTRYDEPKWTPAERDDFRDRELKARSGAVGGTP
jgi:Deoxycytidine deaminase